MVASQLKTPQLGTAGLTSSLIFLIYDIIDLDGLVLGGWGCVCMALLLLSSSSAHAKGSLIVRVGFVNIILYFFFLFIFRDCLKDLR